MPMTRRGYTFLELLLVLAILAIIAGIAWPAVVRFTGEQAVKDAAERVRSELDRTRFRAINAGVNYQFRYEPFGRRFLAVPAELDVAPVQTGSLGQPAPTLPVFAGQMHEGLRFEPMPGVPPTAESIGLEWLGGLPDAFVLHQAHWSAPIIYRPDGTGTSVRFRVTDAKDHFIELSVRDLTGMATAGPLRREAKK
jgi:prepilin-type N-terminal cleavage/methylation domain-containing protein